MIKATELRIGNLVKKKNAYYPSTGGREVHEVYYKVDAGDIYNLATDETFNILHLAPLTPEILEKCGFELDEFRWEKPRMILKLFNNAEPEFYESSFLFTSPLDEQLTVRVNSSEYKSSIEVQYVHQLQNLYFSLTGNELPVKIGRQPLG